MTTTSTNWMTGPLHGALVRALPLYVREPFSESPRINVPKLHKALKISHEMVYRWLRTGRLNPENAKSIVALGNDEDNLAVLTKLGAQPPSIEDFHAFVYGDV